MRRVFPNMITAFSLACGLFVIFKVNMVEPGEGVYEVVQSSVFLLILAAFADFMDGALARAIHAESDFGVIFDSLADAVTFGVAPSVLMLKTLSLEQGTLLSFLSAAGAMIYSVCGVLRLVRYSVKAREVKEGVELAATHKSHFTGLPIPAAAAASVSLNLFFLSPWAVQFFVFSKSDLAILFSSAALALGYLMVCRLKFPSLKMLRLPIPSFYLICATVLALILVLYGILHFFAFTLLLVSWSYIFISLLLSFIRLMAGKKSKTLEEFEPDSEDF
ncbi:MAG: CDP-alcohol phosphatidyltransferase family protein [Verrucomicrobiota bacterium]|nr:CDP-alcohol phosphatidyltransferase family protein [Verrucomicrobiota bacterium]